MSVGGLSSYFTLPKEKMTLEQEEEMMNSELGAYCMAHNGWVMSDDPLRNFAEPGTFSAGKKWQVQTCISVSVGFKEFCRQKCHFSSVRNADFVKNFIRNPGFCHFFAIEIWPEEDFYSNIFPEFPCSRLPLFSARPVFYLFKRSPDGATLNWGNRHLITAYYSSIDPEGMKDWVGLVGWIIVDDLPT